MLLQMIKLFVAEGTIILASILHQESGPISSYSIELSVTAGQFVTRMIDAFFMQEVICESTHCTVQFLSHADPM